MLGQVLKNWQENTRVIDENNLWLKRVEDVPFEEWIEAVPLLELLKHFFSLPLRQPVERMWSVESGPKRMDRMAREFLRVCPQRSAPRITQFHNLPTEVPSITELDGTMDSSALRELIKWSQMVTPSLSRCDATRYVYDAVLHPIEAILAHLHVGFEFRSRETMSKNGYTIMPDILGGYYQGGTFHTQMLVIFRALNFDIGYGARRYFDNAKPSFQEDNFLDAFNEGVQSCAVSGCRLFMLSDGQDYCLFSIEDGFRASQTINLCSFAIISATDSVTTVRAIAFLMMYQLPIPRDESFTDFYFNTFRKTMDEVNEERMSEETEWNIAELEVFTLNLADYMIEEINTGHGINSQTLLVDATGICNHHTAIMCVFDPFYYEISGDNDLRASAYQWFRRERSVYQKLEHLQGTCLPTLLSWGMLRDQWHGDERQLYNGPFLLFQASSFRRASPSSQSDFEAAYAGLELLHANGIQHMALSLDTIFINYENAMFLNFEQARLFHNEAVTDLTDVRCIWPHFEHNDLEEERQLSMSYRSSIPIGMVVNPSTPTL